MSDADDAARRILRGRSFKTGGRYPEEAAVQFVEDIVAYGRDVYDAGKAAGLREALEVTERHLAKVPE